MVETFRPRNAVYKNLELLAKEAANPGLSMAVIDLMGSLSKIAERAIELGDPQLLEECEHLCLVEEEEEKEKEEEKG